MLTAVVLSDTALPVGAAGVARVIAPTVTVADSEVTALEIAPFLEL